MRLRIPRARPVRMWLGLVPLKPFYLCCTSSSLLFFTEQYLIPMALASETPRTRRERENLLHAKIAVTSSYLVSRLIVTLVCSSLRASLVAALTVRTAVSAESKPEEESDDESEEGYATDQEPKSKRRKATSRSRKLSQEERQNQLEGDKWASRFNEHSVVCAGCAKVVKLDRQRKYALGNWAQHKEECASITGKKKIQKRLPSNSKQQVRTCTY